jgi:DNA-binding CsgD family transcriptional regulator
VGHLLGHGRVREAVPAEAEGFAVSAATGARAYQAFFAGGAALHSLQLGSLEDARAWLREGLATWSVGIGAMSVRRAAATLALREGRLPEAREHVERLRELPSFDAHVGVQGPLLLVEFHLALHDPWTALGVVEDNLETQGAVDSRVADELLMWGARAAADLAQDGRDAGARAVVEQAADRLAALVATRARVPGREYEPADPEDLVQPALRAMFTAERARCLGDPAEATQWEKAVDACARAGLRWEEAVARWRYGASLLVTSADHGRTAAALRRAHGLASSIGSGPLTDEVEALARSARISLARPVVPGRDDMDGTRLERLTRREREVLAHLVAGRSYAEIAEALYISQKTVSVHVSNLLRKTGTRNRNEAAAYGRRHGLSPEGSGPTDSESSGGTVKA